MIAPRPCDILWCVARVSPTVEGFRVAFRRPSLAVAEITWRWAIGTTAVTVFFFGLVEYLRTLTVNNAELLFLRSRQPILIGQAIAHMLRGSGTRAMLAALLATIALACLWMIAASIGRMATVRALLEYFAHRRSGLESSTGANQDETAAGRTSDVHAERGAAPGHSLPSLFGINFLRVAVALAAIFGLEGASILADFASPASNPQPGLAFFLFLPLAGLVCLAWYCLNWFLSLAAVFAVRDAEDTLGALSAAAGLCRERVGPVFAVSTWTGLAHFAAFIGATIVVFLPLGLVAALPGRLVIACILLITLAYFVVADWLYTARLGGYVCIIETPEALLAPPPLPPMPSPPFGTTFVPAPQPTSIDRDEVILSDVPSPVVET